MNTSLNIPSRPEWFEYAEDCLIEFFQVFDASTDFHLWMRLVEEETEELREAIIERHDAGMVLKEAADVAYVLAGLNLLLSDELSELVSWETKEAGFPVVAQAEALLSLMVAMFGEDVLEEAIDRVHESNMSKLDDNGQPIRREDGKILKGPNYQPPVLDDLVAEFESQMAA